MRKPIIIGLVFILLLAACSSVTPAPTQAPTHAPTAQPTSPPQTTPIKTTEITWFVHLDDAEQKWQTEVIIPAFQKKFPAIRVSLFVASENDFDTKLLALAAAGKTPDIWSHWGTMGFQEYVRRGLVADLTPYVSKDNYDLADFQPEVLETYRLDGKLYGLPMQANGSFIIYNKDLFDKAGVAYPPTNWEDAGWTYDKFLETCKALTQIKNNAATDVYGCDLNLNPEDAYAWLFGKDLYPDTAYKTGFATQSFLDDPQVIKAYQARQDLPWSLKYQPDQATADKLRVGGDLFANGRVAMVLAGGWNLSTYLAQVRTFKWGVAALPAAAANRRGVIYSDPWMLSAKSEHPQEAWTFLKYLLEAPQQEAWMNLSKAAPTRKSLLDKWAAQFTSMKPDEVKQVVLGAYKYGRETPAHMLVKYNLLEPLLRNAAEPILQNKMKPADVLVETRKKLDSALQQIQAEFKK